MKSYGVKVPITGHVFIEVEAPSEEAAINQAMSSDITIDKIEEWDTCEHICQGNVFYGMLNDAEAEEL
jgi:hypothetical protein